MQRRPLRQSGLRILSDDLGREAMSIPAGAFLPRCVLPRSPLRRGLIINLKTPLTSRRTGLLAKRADRALACSQQWDSIRETGRRGSVYANGDGDAPRQGSHPVYDEIV